MSGHVFPLLCTNFLVLCSVDGEVLGVRITRAVFLRADVHAGVSGPRASCDSLGDPKPLRSYRYGDLSTQLVEPVLSSEVAGFANLSFSPVVGIVVCTAFGL